MQNRALPALPSSLCLLLFACGDAREEADTFVTSSGTSSATSMATTQPGDDESGSDKLDVGDGQGSAENGDNTMGCDKVDFLFVIDNSGSMQDEQQQLKASFPGFINTISQTLNATDYHIMAVSTDNGQNTGLSSTCTNGQCSCTPAPICCENACGFGSNTCNGFDCNNLPIGECDKKYGSGKQWDEKGTWCELSDMRRYMLDTQADIPGTFNCIASVGTYGSGDEKPMLALTEAISAMQNDASGCNSGFLRKDAILVVTFITDEEDDHVDGGGSPGDPADWYQAVVAAKNNDPNAVVVLGLVGDGDVPGGVCQGGADPNSGGDGAEPSPRLRSFVEMFPRGSLGSICSNDFTPFFQQAVSVIDTTCDEFVPPG